MSRISQTLTVISLLLLFPGVFLPMFTMQVHGGVRSKFGNVEMEILNQTRSILQTVYDLYENNQLLVSFLILFFSIIVPVLKCTAIFAYFSPVFIEKRNWLRKVLAIISKWSMADVFVVAVFLAYLSTQKNPAQSAQEASIMGFAVQFNTIIAVQSRLHSGFYFFLFYCLTSSTAITLLDLKHRESEN